MGSGPLFLVFESCVCHLLAVRFGASYLICMYLQFLASKMQMIVPTLQDCCEGLRVNILNVFRSMPVAQKVPFQCLLQALGFHSIFYGYSDYRREEFSAFFFLSFSVSSTTLSTWFFASSGLSHNLVSLQFLTRRAIITCQLLF